MCAFVRLFSTHIGLLLFCHSRRRRFRSLRSKFAAMRDAASGGFCGCRSKNVTALMSRGAKRMLRNWTFLLFTFLVPALQVILFCVAIGQQPKGLHLAVVNQDAGIDTVPTIFGPLPLPAVNLGNQVWG